MRHDGDAVNGWMMLEEVDGRSSTGFVVRAPRPEAHWNDAADCFGADEQALDRRVHLGDADLAFAASNGEDGALIHNLCEVSTGETSREVGDQPQIDCRIQRLASRVYGQDGLTPGAVWPSDHHLTVEATRPE
jgi:hypothetical protein